MLVSKIPPLASDFRYEEIGIQKRLFNIDSRYYRKDSGLSTLFEHRFQDSIHNVISINVSSIELPNTQYNISEYLKTNKISIVIGPNEFDVTLSDGNYSLNDLMLDLETKLNASGYGDWSITFNVTNGKLTFTETNGNTFNILFDKYNNFPKRTRNFGMSTLLGFTKKVYMNQTSYTSDTLVNLFGETYYFLKINDYGLISNRTRETETFNALAKVMINTTKNAYVYDNANFITKRYVFQRPVDIDVLNIQLLDSYGIPVNLENQDWSFTIELEVIMNSYLYETYRKHLLSPF
jgi:hypothetical protein